MSHSPEVSAGTASPRCQNFLHLLFADSLPHQYLLVFSCSVSFMNLLDASAFTGGSTVGMGISCLLLCEFSKGWSQPSTDRLQRPMKDIKPPHTTPEAFYRVRFWLARLECKVLYTSDPFAHSQALGV